MNVKSIIRAILPPFLTPTAWSSQFESVNYSSRRSTVPGAAPTDAKRELTGGIRSEMVRKARYLHKNSGFVRELVGNMAIYSTGDGIRVQATSDDHEWNEAAEEYFEAWSTQCEITRRFSFAECQSMVCKGMDVDGEYFIHKTRNQFGEPRLQLIESHRVGDSMMAAASRLATDGVVLDEFGAPVAYKIKLDDNTTGEIPASAMLHVFEAEWASAVRAHPPLQHSINNVLDELELLALEKHAVKDNSDVSRVLTTERGEIDDNGDFKIAPTANDEDDTDGQSNPLTLQKIVGGKLVKLQPGEKLEAFESKRPSPTFTGFLEHLRRDSALGVLPFEFAADSSKIGGAGVRLVVAKADRKFSFRQMILHRRLIAPVWFYVIGDAIQRGILPVAPGWWKIATVPPRRITVDAGREAQQNRADVDMGLKTLSDHFAENGATFSEELERRGKDAQMILAAALKFGVPVDMLWKPSGAKVEQPDTEDAPSDDDSEKPTDDSLKFETLKAKFDAYGVAVRAGAITPEQEDEIQFRNEAGLPAMSDAVSGAWKDDGGFRRPITLAQKSAAGPPPQDRTDDPKE